MIESNKVVLQIEQRANKYTELERNVMKFVMENPLFVIENSITDFAKKCGVSEATISRFARKAGFKGFNELKILLSQEYFKAGLQEKAIANTLLEKLLKDYQEILNKAATSIEREKVDKFIKLISEAKRIKVYGIGSSGLFATEMSYKFSRIGYDIRAITDSHIMRMDAAISKRNDLIIGVSLSGVTLDVVESLELARANRSKTIAFTNYPDSKISQNAHLIITVPQKDLLDTGQFITSMFPLLVILDYLYAEIVSKDLEKYLSIKSKTIHAVSNKIGK